MTSRITSSEMSVFQSTGVGGRFPAQRAALTVVSEGVSEIVFSRAMIAPHSVSDIFLSQARTSAMLVVGAAKKFGYVSFALAHFGVRNSTDLTISIGRDGVAPLASAAVSSSSVGETWRRRDGIVW